MKNFTKKIFITTLTLCSLFNVFYFSSCNDQEKNAETGMSKTEWESALSLDNFDNFTMISENPTDVDYNTATFIPTTTKYTIDKISVGFYSNGEWTEQTVESEQVALSKTRSLAPIFVLLDFDLFTYNAIEDIYEAKNVDTESLLRAYYEENFGAYNGQFSQVYSQFTAKFTDGKLSKLDCFHDKKTETGFTPYGAAKYTFYDYGTTVISA